MSREKSKFLSGFGTAFQIFKTVTDAVLAAGGDDEDLRRVLLNKDLVDKIVRVIVGEDPRYKLTVDYAQTLARMIQVGNYGWVNKKIIQENFPNHPADEGREEVVIKLLSFNGPISSENALEKMGKWNLRSVRIEELLALGAAYPELQKKSPIICLGSVWQHRDGGRFIPYLSWDAERRNLDLLCFENDWDKCWRFAVVRK